MFKDEATKQWRIWNLKRCKKPKKVLKDVKKDLMYKAKRSLYHDENGKVQCWSHYQITQEDFQELKILCEQDGIKCTSEWKSINPELYCFEMQVC